MESRTRSRPGAESIARIIRHGLFLYTLTVWLTPAFHQSNLRKVDVIGKEGLHKSLAKQVEAIGFVTTKTNGCRNRHRMKRLVPLSNFLLDEKVSSRRQPRRVLRLCTIRFDARVYSGQNKHLPLRRLDELRHCRLK